MDTHNFKLSSVFYENAKEYQTRPVMAAKYQPGMENGFCVHYSNLETKTNEAMMFEGIRFFPSKEEALEFINRNEKQCAMENGELIETEVIYDEPEPVLYRKDANARNWDGLHFYFGEHAFISDESVDYEFYILDCKWCDNDTWIILDSEGNIRVWDSTSEELFFGKEKDIVYQKAGNDEYIKIAV